MRSRSAVAWADAPVELPRATHADLAALSRRLGLPTAREAVALDFLEDDLREAELALGAVTDWLGAVEETLRDPGAGRRELLALSRAEGPIDRIEYLAAMAASIRRRIAQVAGSPPGPAPGRG
jgi:hypothetical protein